MKMLYEVLDEMLQHIPAREKALIADLKKAHETSRYQSPQSQGIAWDKARDSLNIRFQKPAVRGWGKKIRQIWDREREAVDAELRQIQ